MNREYLLFVLYYPVICKCFLYSLILNVSYLLGALYLLHPAHDRSVEFVFYIVKPYLIFLYSNLFGVYLFQMHVLSSSAVLGFHKMPNIKHKMITVSKNSD